MKAVAIVGLASLASGERAKIRENAGNLGKHRSLQQIDESWYDIPDQMPNHHNPVHYQYPPAYHYGGEEIHEAKAGKEEVMPESKTSKEGHGNPSGGMYHDSSAKTSKIQHEVEEHYRPPKTSGSAAKTAKTHPEDAPLYWQPDPGIVMRMHAEEEVEWMDEPSGNAKTAKVLSEEVVEMKHATEAKSAKAKSAKTKSDKDDNSGDWWGSMPTVATSTAATIPIATTSFAHLPAAKGHKDDDMFELTVTSSTWWAASESKTTKSGKSPKTTKSGKSGKTGKTTESEDSWWGPPTPCGKAEDCEHLDPPTTDDALPSEEHSEPDVIPPTPSPIAPLVPVTIAPVIGETRIANTGTSSPTTIIDALTAEAGWFQSDMGFETEQLAYKRARVEGLAQQMEWKNSSSRAHTYTYLAVGAAAGLFFILC